MHMRILQVATIGIIAGAVYFYLKQHQRSKYPTGVPGPSNMQRVNRDDYVPGMGIHTVRGGSPVCTRCGNVEFVGENCAIPLASDYLQGAPDAIAAISQCNLGINRNDGDNWRIRRQEVATSFPFGIRVGSVSIGARLILTDDLQCNPDINSCIPSTEVI